MNINIIQKILNEFEVHVIERDTMKKSEISKFYLHFDYLRNFNYYLG